MDQNQDSGVVNLISDSETDEDTTNTTLKSSSGDKKDTSSRLEPRANRGQTRAEDGGKQLNDAKLSDGAGTSKKMVETIHLNPNYRCLLGTTEDNAVINWNGLKDAVLLRKNSQHLQNKSTSYGGKILKQKRSYEINPSSVRFLNRRNIIKFSSFNNQRMVEVNKIKKPFYTKFDSAQRNKTNNTQVSNTDVKKPIRLNNSSLNVVKLIDRSRSLPDDEVIIIDDDININEDNKTTMNAKELLSKVESKTFSSTVSSNSKSTTLQLDEKINKNDKTPWNMFGKGQNCLDTTKKQSLRDSVNNSRTNSNVNECNNQIIKELDFDFDQSILQTSLSELSNGVEEIIEIHSFDNDELDSLIECSSLHSNETEERIDTVGVEQGDSSVSESSVGAFDTYAQVTRVKQKSFTSKDIKDTKESKTTNQEVIPLKECFCQSGEIYDDQSSAVSVTGIPALHGAISDVSIKRRTSTIKPINIKLPPCITVTNITSEVKERKIVNNDSTIGAFDTYAQITRVRSKLFTSKDIKDIKESKNTIQGVNHLKGSFCQSGEIYDDQSSTVSVTGIPVLHGAISDVSIKRRTSTVKPINIKLPPCITVTNITCEVEELKKKEENEIKIKELQEKMKIEAERKRFEKIEDKEKLKDRMSIEKKINEFYANLRIESESDENNQLAMSEVQEETIDEDVSLNNEHRDCNEFNALNPIHNQFNEYIENIGNNENNAYFNEFNTESVQVQRGCLEFQRQSIEQQSKKSEEAEKPRVVEAVIQRSKEAEKLRADEIISRKCIEAEMKRVKDVELEILNNDRIKIAKEVETKKHKEAGLRKNIAVEETKIKGLDKKFTLKQVKDPNNLLFGHPEVNLVKNYGVVPPVHFKKNNEHVENDTNIEQELIESRKAPTNDEFETFYLRELGKKKYMGSEGKTSKEIETNSTEVNMITRTKGLMVEEKLKESYVSKNVSTELRPQIKSSGSPSSGASPTRVENPLIPSYEYKKQTRNTDDIIKRNTTSNTLYDKKNNRDINIDPSVIDRNFIHKVHQRSVNNFIKQQDINPTHDQNQKQIVITTRLDKLSPKKRGRKRRIDDQNGKQESYSINKISQNVAESNTLIKEAEPPAKQTRMSLGLRGCKNDSVKKALAPIQKQIVTTTQMDKPPPKKRGRKKKINIPTEKIQENRVLAPIQKQIVPTTQMDKPPPKKRGRKKKINVPTEKIHENRVLAPIQKQIVPTTQMDKPPPKKRGRKKKINVPTEKIQENRVLAPIQKQIVPTTQMDKPPPKKRGRKKKINVPTEKIQENRVLAPIQIQIVPTTQMDKPPPKKRGRKKKINVPTEKIQENRVLAPIQKQIITTTQMDKPPPKKRGRKKKINVPTEKIQENRVLAPIQKQIVPTTQMDKPPPKKRGRKKKINVPTEKIQENRSNENNETCRRLMKFFFNILCKKNKYISNLNKEVTGIPPPYVDVIKCPVESQDIKRKIAAGEITNLTELQLNLLILSYNALMINRSDSIVFSDASKFQFDLQNNCQDLKDAVDAHYGSSKDGRMKKLDYNIIDVRFPDLNYDPRNNNVIINKETIGDTLYKYTINECTESDDSNTPT